MLVGTVSKEKSGKAGETKATKAAASEASRWNLLVQ